MAPRVWVVSIGAVLLVGGLGFGAGRAAERSGGDGGDRPTAAAATTSTGATTTTASARLDPPLELSVVDVREPERVLAQDPELGTLQGSPLDDLPAGVRQLVEFGQRPDWSPDGEQIAFLDGSPLGDVWVVDVATGTSRNLTGELGVGKFSRAYHLSNGDLLLCGPLSGPQPSPEHPESGRFTGVMSVLRAPFDTPPVHLGVSCWEGMATSSSSLRIAWNRSDIDYTDPDVDRILNGITEIWTGELRYDGELVSIVNARKVLDRDAFGSFAVFEVQGFRPPDDRELIVTAYAFQAGEVMGLDLESGELRNYSNSTAYEEAEGVAPSGDSVYVERDLEYTGLPGALDIWRLDLADAGWTRVTTFNRWAPYYASNPSVSPDGRTLAFQLSIDGETEGQGDGILLMDLGAA